MFRSTAASLLAIVLLQSSVLAQSSALATTANSIQLCVSTTPFPIPIIWHALTYPVRVTIPRNWIKQSLFSQHRGLQCVFDFLFCSTGRRAGSILLRQTHKQPRCFNHSEDSRPAELWSLLFSCLSVCCQGWRSPHSGWNCQHPQWHHHRPREHQPDDPQQRQERCQCGLWGSMGFRI
jgi:hypothetical protein